MRTVFEYDINAEFAKSAESISSAFLATSALKPFTQYLYG
jgi:hypothetical protein